MKKLIFSGIVVVCGLYYLSIDSPESNMKGDNQVQKTVETKDKISNVKIVDLDKQIKNNLSKDQKELPKYSQYKNSTSNFDKAILSTKDKNYIKYLESQQRYKAKSLNEQRHKMMMQKIQASKQKQLEFRKQQQQQIALRMQQQQRLQTMQKEQLHYRYKSMNQQMMQRNISKSKQINQSS